MALRLKPETREAWKRRLEAGMDTTWRPDTSWRPVPRAEPAPEKVYDTHTYDIYSKTWVDT